MSLPTESATEPTPSRRPGVSAARPPAWVATLAPVALLLEVVALAMFVVMLGRKSLGVTFTEAELGQWAAGAVFLQTVGLVLGYGALRGAGPTSTARRIAAVAVGAGGFGFAAFFLYSLVGAALVQ